MCEVDGTIRETMAARDSENGIVMSNAAEHVLMFRYSDVLLTWPAGGNFKRPALPKRFFRRCYGVAFFAVVPTLLNRLFFASLRTYQ